MIRTFVYKLKPAKAQILSLESTLTTCRYLYNSALSARILAYKLDERSISDFEQCSALSVLRKSDKYLQVISSQVLQNVIKRVDKSFKNFFRRLKDNKEKSGFPRFKSDNSYHSFTYPSYGNGVKFKNNKLYIFNIGEIKFYNSQPYSGNPKTVTIIKKADGWYAHLVCEVEANPLPEINQSVGIDLGLESFLTLSTGEQISNPKFLRKSEKKLKFCQRRVSRRKLGSSHRRKAVKLLAKAHLKISRQRLDFLHKTANSIITRFDTISVENLNISGMIKNKHLAKSIADVSWGKFIQLLKEKAESAARKIVEINPAYTSQICSNCGNIVKKKLSERQHKCPECGLVIHRDTNAAINIRNKGQDMAFGEMIGLLVI